MQRVPVVISGPSGVGKSTLMKHLLEKAPNFRLCISHTTREQRAGEVNGREYFFVSRAEFEEMIAQNEFFEYEEYNHNLYGTSTREMYLGKKVPLIDWERKGVLAARKNNFNARFVFVWCPRAEVERRLRNRAGKDVLCEAEETDIQARLLEYEKDMQVWESGAYDVMVVNNDIKDAVSKLYEFLGLASE